LKYFSASITDIGRKRKINEDNLLDASDKGVWVVADGMGGHEAGEVASGRLVEALAELPAGGDTEEIAAETDRIIHEVNTELLHLAQGGPTPRTIGCTVVALSIRNGHFVCQWAGDSRCYRVRGREIHRVSRDHSLVDDLVRSGLLDPKDAEHHPDANVITRAVGATRELQVDRVDGDALPGDIFLLASDGVTRVMADEELAQVLASHNPVQAGEVIKSTVLERGAPDNLTAIIVRVL